MGEFQVAGAELKKFVKVMRKKPVAFAFNAGDGDDGYFGVHRTKSSRLIGKEAKEEGPGNKFAFGTATVVGKVMQLRCEREMPGLAKKLKRYLKSQKTVLNVQVLDADGNVLDSDIEDGLPDDPDLYEDEDGEGDTTSTGKAAAPTPESKVADGAAAPTPAPDGDIAGRIKAIGERIKALPKELGAQLFKPYKAVVERFKAGEIDRASAGVEKLEAAVATLEARSAKAAEGAASAPEAPQLAKIRQAIALIGEKAGALPDATHRSRVETALRAAEAHVAAGEASPAMAQVKAAKEALTQPPPASAAQPDPMEAKWFEAFGKLDPVVQDALQNNRFADEAAREAVRQEWGGATANAENGLYSKAMASLPKIVQLLKKGRESGNAGGPAADASAEVQPFADAKLEWQNARKTMKAELGRLKAEIAKVCAGDPELEPVVKSVSELDRYILVLDGKLEDKLADIVKSEAGEDRDSHKKSAIDLIGAYESELESDFFSEVDSNNGFTQVAVTATAKAALSQIRAVLS